MKLGVVTPGERRTIDVRRSRDGWVATIGDRTLAVSLARAGARWSVIVGPPGETPMASHEVALDWSARGAWLIAIDGHRVPVTLAGADPPLAPGPPTAPTGSVAVVAPMPGRVVTVLVSPGQAVAARQGLVVVEAMKMENEVTAPVAGTVTEVLVTAGTTVGGKTVLVVLTPNAER